MERLDIITAREQNGTAREEILVPKNYLDADESG